jgi:hypothetical protein
VSDGGLTEAEQRAERRMEKRLAEMVESPAGNRCITCGHVKHNELGYCQTGQCICGDGTTVAGQAAIIRRDLPGILAARSQRPEAVAQRLYEMNGFALYGRNLGDWNDPASEIGRNEHERARWVEQARSLGLAQRPEAVAGGPPAEGMLTEVEAEALAWTYVNGTYRDLPHAARERMEKARATVERIKADAYAAGRASVHVPVEPDNHHNAALCPYCTPLAARSQRPEGVTVTEWGVRYTPGAPITERPPYMYEVTRPWSKETALAEAERTRDMRGPATAFSRQRTTFPDVVTEWAEVSGDTEAGGDRG